MAWLQRHALEHSNLRVALDRLLAQADYERPARACYALWRLWFNHGTWGEARRWLEAILDEHIAAVLPPGLRGRALLATGMTLAMQSDFAHALAICEESLELLRQAGDQECLSDVFEGITHAKWGLSDVAARLKSASPITMSGSYCGTVASTASRSGLRSYRF